MDVGWILRLTLISMEFMTIETKQKRAHSRVVREASACVGCCIGGPLSMDEPLEEASLSIGLALERSVEYMIYYRKKRAKKIEDAIKLGTFDIFDG